MLLSIEQAPQQRKNITAPDHTSTIAITMSAFSNLTSLARSKLHSSLASGSRDNLSLHRWVLLKNSLTREDFSVNNSVYSTVSDSSDVDSFEDDDVDNMMDLEEDSYIAFLFPDPGYAPSPNASSEDDLSKENPEMSEAQWLDSLLEKLGDDEDDEDDLSVHSPSGVALDEHASSPSEPSSPTLSFNEELDLSTSPSDRGFVPYPPVLYPPFHPPLLFDIDSPHNYFHSARQPSTSSPCDSYHDIDDPFFSALPDTIEDTSDDETDSLATPSTRSRSSLNLSLDAHSPTSEPASIPLSFDCDNDKQIRHSPRREVEMSRKTTRVAVNPFYTYEVDPLPYSDGGSDSAVAAPIYGPYQFC
jgi:hypothetical protein